MKEDDRQLFPLSEEGRTNQQARREKEKIEAREKKALEAKRIAESIPTVFDDPDFFKVDGRLLELEEILGPNFVVFNTRAKGGENSYTIGFLRRLFKDGMNWAERTIQSRKDSDLELTKDDIDYLQKFYRESGITGQKIGEQSKIGLRDCLIQCIQNFIRSSKDNTRLFEINE